MSNMFKGLNAVRDRFYQDVADKVSARIQKGNVLDAGTGRGLFPIKIAQKNENCYARS